MENGRFAAPLRELVLPPRCRSGVSHLRTVTHLAGIVFGL
ncbi:hypothetical protein MUK42_02535 [Musa troglodytarum]|nr:hypothetical protein MUK42_08069 [Musa troglodytarum]URD80531.1 hypothetical protein MUK42_02535 [Musa troglodytarum]